MMFSAQQAPYTCAAAVFMTAQPLLIKYSQNADGTFDYSVASSNMLSEALKLIIASVLLGLQLAREPATRADLFGARPLREFFDFFVIAFIYFVNNNLAFAILETLSPSEFQLVSQTKIIFTGLLFRAILSRRLSLYQWLALFVLACGTGASQVE